MKFITNEPLFMTLWIVGEGIFVLNLSFLQQTIFATNIHITCEDSLFFKFTSRIFCNKLNIFNNVMETSFITIVDLFYEDSSLFYDHNKDFCYKRLRDE